MHIGPLGILEIIIILVVVLIIFGPKNLPKLGTAIGKAMKNLREGIGSKKKVKEAKDSDDVEVIEVIDKPQDTAETTTTETVTVEAAEEQPVVSKPKPKSALDEDESTKA